jgi:hypothetical protein
MRAHTHTFTHTNTHEYRVSVSQQLEERHHIAPDFSRFLAKANIEVKNKGAEPA